MSRPRLAALIVLTAATATLGAQNPVRRLTSIDALREYPGYYHLQPVLLRGEFTERGTELVFSADDQELRLLNPSEARTGPVEVRCTMIDVGRLEPGDPRLAGYASRRNDEWPRPGAELLLQIASVDRAEPAVTPSIRAIALEPWKFAGQTVTVTGTFRGRNLFGDLPNAPAKSRYDFVLTGTEGALWVTGLRPRGRGFDLDVDRRLDTNRTIEVTGKVGREHGLVTIAATTIALGTPPAPGETSVEPPAALQPSPPAQVVFSAPTADETDVALDTTVRIQFSRGLRESSLADQVRATYLDARAGDPPIVFKTSYDAATRAIQIRFARPLERFRTVRVELLGGIRAFDDGVFTPWSVTFSTGGR